MHLSLRAGLSAGCWGKQGIIRAMPFADPPLTKRQLGWLALIGSCGLAVGILAVDWLGAGRFSGVGPAQGQALAGAGGMAVFSVTLILRGGRLA